MEIQGHKIRALEEELKAEIMRLHGEIDRVNASRIHLLQIIRSLLLENEFWRAKITRLIYPDTASFSERKNE